MYSDNYGQNYEFDQKYNLPSFLRCPSFPVNLRRNRLSIFEDETQLDISYPGPVTLCLHNTCF